MSPLDFNAVFRPTGGGLGEVDTNPWDDIADSCAPARPLTSQRAVQIAFGASEVFTWAPFLLALSMSPGTALSLAVRRQLQLGALSAAVGGLTGMAIALGPPPKRNC